MMILSSCCPIMRNFSKVFNVVVAFFFSPERKILLKEFNYWLSISKFLFSELVNLVKGSLKWRICKFACSLLVLHHLIVENWKIESKAETDGIAWWEWNTVCFSISLKCFLLNSFKTITSCSLSNISVIVSNKLNKESTRLFLNCTTVLKNLWSNKLNDVVAIFVQVILEPFLVGRKLCCKLTVLRVLFDGRNSS